MVRTKSKYEGDDKRRIHPTAPTLQMMKVKHDKSKKLLDWRSLGRSPWILHFDTGGCNGCPIEVLAALTPRYDLERFGAINKGNPKLADLLLVTGSLTAKASKVLVNLYAQMPEPKVVVAIGTCCCDNGVFDGCYHLRGPIYNVLPVDVYVPGCAPRPGTIIEGVVKGLQVWKAKKEEMEG